MGKQLHTVGRAGLVAAVLLGAVLASATGPRPAGATATAPDAATRAAAADEWIPGDALDCVPRLALRPG